MKEIKIPPVHTEQTVIDKALKLMGVQAGSLIGWKIIKRSVDARDKRQIFYVYSIEAEMDEQAAETALRARNTEFAAQEDAREVVKVSKVGLRPVIIGAGPSGLFAAMTLVEAGLKPVIAERGKKVEERISDVHRMIANGVLNTESNIQFGEGGAGTFSDGKLTTGIKGANVKRVFEAFVRFGAPQEILYDAKPHIGTDILVDVVVRMRKYLEDMGAEFLFSHKMVDFTADGGKISEVILLNNEKRVVLEADELIIAAGHSARDLFELLKSKSVKMERKPFAVGFRIEHLRKDINEMQFGHFANGLPAADYKLFTHLPNGKGVYTFCCCPGGEVIPASSEQRRLAVNGMSKYARNAVNTNSALLVSVEPGDFAGSDVMAGINFQRDIETRAFDLGGGGFKAPVQLLGDFMNKKTSGISGNVVPSYKPGYTFADLNVILGDGLTESLRKGILDIDRKCRGFYRKDAILTAVESRSSSPVRICRNEKLQANIENIYPCGEGAGYAGGIVSAAVDGIRCAENIVFKYS